MKTIAIFGITGKTGRFLLDLLLEETDYNIKALVRNPKSIQKNDRVKIILGDIQKLEVVNDVIKNSDFVISVIGHTKNSPKEIQTIGIKNIIESMNKNGVKKIISLTGTGVRIENDKPSNIDRIANFLIKKIDPDRVLDGINHYHALKNTNLDWVIIRVLKLTNQNKIQKYKFTEHDKAKTFVSRKTVSMGILSLLRDGDWPIKKLLVIS